MGLAGSSKCWLLLKAGEVGEEVLGTELAGQGCVPHSQGPLPTVPEQGRPTDKSNHVEIITKTHQVQGQASPGGQFNRTYGCGTAKNQH